VRREAVRRLKELGVPQSTVYDEIKRLSRKPKSERPYIEMKGNSIRLLDVKGIEIERYRDEAEVCTKIIREAYGLEPAASVPLPMNEQKRSFYIGRLYDLTSKGLSGDYIARTLIDALKSDRAGEDKVQISRILQRLSLNARDGGDKKSLIVIKGALWEKAGSEKKGLMDMVLDTTEHIEVRCTIISTLQMLGDWEVLRVIEHLGEYEGDQYSSKILERLDSLADRYHEQDAVAVLNYLKKMLDHEEEGVRLRAKRLLKHVLK